MKNRFIYGFIACFTILMILGCSSILKNNEGVFGKSSVKNAAIQTEVRNIEVMQARKDVERLYKIGAWSDGVEYTLNQITTNVPKEVVIAKEVNERVKALANKPDFNEVKEVHAIIDKLLSEIQTVRNDGEKALAKKDKEIEKLNVQMRDLAESREVEIGKAFELANSNALKNDQLATTLKQMDSWFGLGAVGYGLKRFVTSAMWILGIGGLIFLLLRAFAASNPIIGSIFAIVEQMFSWVINTVRVIAPKATKVAGFTETKVSDGYKNILSKVIDAIETAKVKQDAAVKAGAPANTVIDDIMSETGHSMNQDDKDRVSEAKKALLWK